MHKSSFFRKIADEQKKDVKEPVIENIFTNTKKVETNIVNFVKDYVFRNGDKTVSINADASIWINGKKTINSGGEIETNRVVSGEICSSLFQCDGKSMISDLDVEGNIVCKEKAIINTLAVNSRLICEGFANIGELTCPKINTKKIVCSDASFKSAEVDNLSIKNGLEGALYVSNVGGRIINSSNVEDSAVLKENVLIIETVIENDCVLDSLNIKVFKKSSYFVSIDGYEPIQCTQRKCGLITFDLSTIKCPKNKRVVFQITCENGCVEYYGCSDSATESLPYFVLFVKPANNMRFYKDLYINTNVGIKTFEPQYDLEVNGTAYAQRVLTNDVVANNITANQVFKIISDNGQIINCSQTKGTGMVTVECATILTRLNIDGKIVALQLYSSKEISRVKTIINDRIIENTVENNVIRFKNCELLSNVEIQCIFDNPTELFATDESVYYHLITTFNDSELSVCPTGFNGKTISNKCIREIRGFKRASNQYLLYDEETRFDGIFSGVEASVNNDGAYILMVNDIAVESCAIEGYLYFNLLEYKLGSAKIVLKKADDGAFVAEECKVYFLSFEERMSILRNEVIDVEKCGDIHYLVDGFKEITFGDFRTKGKKGTVVFENILDSQVTIRLANNEKIMTNNNVFRDGMMLEGGGICSLDYLVIRNDLLLISNYHKFKPL